jgi:Bardet-Biedl syndrome 5 protein
MTIKKAKSKLRGSTQALCVMAKQTSRYEFLFTSLVKNSPRLFTTVQAVLRAYQTSKLYRDLKLRGSIVKDSKSPACDASFLLSCRPPHLYLYD